MDILLPAVVALVVIVGVAAFSNRLGVAAPLLLVLVGVGMSLIPGFPEVEIEPEWILAVVLPPILYGAAVNVPLTDFRRNLRSITGLGVVLVVVSAVGSGLVLYWLLPDLSLAGAIALGAVISPPDAVAATSIAKRVGLPPRLVTVLEGESLINDATALVLLRTAIAASAGAFSFWGAVGDFFAAAAGAIAVGIVAGFVGVWIRSRLTDPVLTTAISFGVPFIAYLPAEHFGWSGVLAVVVAGLLTGHESAKRFTAQDRISERINWRTVSFLLENSVFLLMGYELEVIVADADSGIGIWTSVTVGLVATGVLILIRYVFLVPLIASLRGELRRAREGRSRLDQITATFQEMLHRDGGRERTEREQRRYDGISRRIRQRTADMDFSVNQAFGWRGGIVLGWAGMRGVVTLAAAQSLPRDLPYRPQLILIAFTVAIVTLLLQGGTLPYLIRLVKLPGHDKQQARLQLASLLDELNAIAAERLDDPELAQPDGTPYDPEVVQRVRSASMTPSKAVWERARQSGKVGPQQQYRRLRLMVLEAERAALLDARAEGAYDSEALNRAQLILDQEQSALEQLEGH